MSKIFIIGSISCEERIKEIASKYISEGYDVDYVKPQPDKLFNILVRECYDKIKLADHVIAVSKPDGSFGKGTTYEIAFAEYIGHVVHKY